MKSNYNQLGQYIEMVSRTNSDLKYGIEDVSGIEKVSRKNNNRFYQVIFYKLLSDFQLCTIIR